MLRIGLLGASRIAPIAVLEPAAGRDDVEVTAVAARDPHRAAEFARAHGIPHVAADYGDLIVRNDVDIVYNGLPPSAHLEWTLAALAAGKAVLCEKPFAMNAREAKIMVEAAQAAGLPLIEAFHYRFHNVMRRAEALVRSGALGTIHRAYGVFEVPIARTPDELRWRAELGGGGLMDLGCYPIHALRTLIGEEPQVREARGEFVDGVDVRMTAALAFPSGARAEIACAMVTDTRAARLTLGGSKGRLEILNFLAPQMGCRFTTVIDGKTVEQPVDGPTTYEAQLEHVVEVMREGAPALTGGADAVANMAVIDRIYALAGR
ncbi:MAG TPA: Gfo/Idh/MocA family oxidoreductase [Phenylobacterium sp.]|nr:Gfo/Idh/MocA family oxidoreductase [Phenylobacterium sp.]